MNSKSNVCTSIEDEIHQSVVKISPTIYHYCQIELMFKTYSAFVSGVGKSPIVVNVNVDQYKLPRYFRVNVA